MQIRNALVDGARALLAPGERFTAASTQALDAIFAAIEHYDSSRQPAFADRRAARDSFAASLRGSVAHLSPEDRAEANHRARILNIAEAVTTQGGFLVPAGVLPELLVKQKFYNAVASAAKVIETVAGNPLTLATTDDTVNSGALLAEATGASNLDINFGQATLNAWKFTSGVVPVSFEILQDSAVDVAGFVLDLFAQRLGRIQNTYFTTGSGAAGQPQGIVTGASSGVVLPTGNTTTITYGGLLALWHSIDPAYRASPNCGWMMNDATLLAIKQLTDVNGTGAPTNARPLWLPDTLPPPPGSPQHGTLLGKPVWTNPDMAVMAANAKPIIFGDLSQYWVRQVKGAAVLQLNDSAYSSKGQAAFIAFARADGRVVSASTAAIKYLQMSAT